MKRAIIIFIATVSALGAASGQLTIEECYERARINYPLVSRYGLIEQSEQYDLGNASRGWLPQFGLSAQATYQTDVTNIGSMIPESLSGQFDIPKIPKDQYQIVGEVRQAVWDGGTIRAAKEAIQAQGDVDRARYEVDMYALRERINQLFFGILLIDEQLRINDIFISELQVNYQRVRSYEANGVANSADVDAVRVEQVTARQNRVQLESMRRAYVNMLSAFIGEELGPDTELVKPTVRRPVPGAWIMRPELGLYDAMSRQADVQRRSITASNMPQLGFFVQGGYGNPGLNMFKDKFTTYAIGGIKLSWNFGRLYNRRTDLLKVDNALRNIDVQRETFLFNLGLQERQLRAEYEKYDAIMAQDDEIIGMRRNILRSSQAKLDNGIISVSDLVRDMNAEQNARVNKAVHEVEMLQTIYALKNLTNN